MAAPHLCPKTAGEQEAPAVLLARLSIQPFPLLAVRKLLHHPPPTTVPVVAHL